MVQQYIKPAPDGLAGADRYLLDDSGFYRYCTRSTQGLRNQGRKDSDEAIVHADGSQVKPPLGTCEMQAFVYASKMHLAEVLWWLDDSKATRRLLREAEDLKRRFNDFFWIEEAGLRFLPAIPHSIHFLIIVAQSVRLRMPLSCWPSPVTVCTIECRSSR